MLHSSFAGIFLVSGGSSLNDWLELAGILILCILVIAASYFVTKFIGTKQMGRQKNGNFQIVEVCSIAPGKTLQLIRTGDRYLVIAVTKETVTKLAELTKDEIFFAEEKEQKQMGFSEIFATLTGKKEKPASDKKTDLLKDFESEENPEINSENNRKG